MTKFFFSYSGSVYSPFNSQSYSLQSSLFIINSSDLRFLSAYRIFVS